MSLLNVRPMRAPLNKADSSDDDDSDMSSLFTEDLSPERSGPPDPPSWCPVPVHHPGLRNILLPHGQLVHVRRRPVRVELSEQEDQAGRALGPFGWGPLVDELKRQPPLEQQLRALLAPVIRCVRRTPPYKVQAKWAALHDIERGWALLRVGNEMRPAGVAFPHFPPEEASKAFDRHSYAESQPSQPPREPVRPSAAPARFRLDAALQRESVLLKGLKKFLHDRPIDEVNAYILSTPLHDVERYLHAYLALALPWKAVFGSTYNLRIFHRGLREYLSLGQREEMSVLDVMAGIRFSDVPWLRNVEEERRELFLAGFMLWVYRRLVNPLVNRLFYVTLTSYRKTQYLFYRREVWMELLQAAVRERLNRKQWVCVQERPKELEMLLEPGQAAVFNVRFLAKPNGVRPVMMVTDGEPLPYGHEGSGKVHLKKIRHILDFLLTRFIGPGHGCQGAPDIQSAWQRLRAARLQNSARPLLFVCMDIHQAYESINMVEVKRCFDRLFHQLKNRGIDGVLVYDLVREGRVEWRRARQPGQRFVVALPGEVGMDERCRGLTPHKMSLDTLFYAARHLLKPVIFQVFGKWHLLATGIPQGDPLSGWLMNVYLRMMEKDMSFVTLEDELLLRYYDDMIFLTPYPKRLRQWLRLYAIFFVKYKLQITSRKAHSNAPSGSVPDEASFQGLGDLVLPVPPVQGGCSHEGQHLISWFGWMFDLAGLSVSVDVGRFMCLDLRYSVPRSDTHHGLVASLRGKYHPVMMDLASSPASVIVQNVYNMFLLAGVRLLAYWRRCRRAARTTQQVTMLLQLLARDLVRTAVQQLPAALEPFVEWRVEALAWLAFAQVLAGRLSGTLLNRGCKRWLRAACFDHLRQLALFDQHNTWDIEGFVREREKRWPDEFQLLAKVMMRKD